jgi:glycosyltransferase involved in cell wall biosynthesis
MRIVHLSYVQLTRYNDPITWLNRINFYTGVIEQMAVGNKVFSIHCINYEGIVKRNGVEYHFLKANRWTYLAPLALHAYIKRLKPDAVIVHGLLFSWQIFLLAIQTGSATRIIAQHHAERPLTFPRNLFQKFNDRWITIYFFSSLELALPWVEQRQIRSTTKIKEVMEASSIFTTMNRDEALRLSKVSGSPVYLWVGRLDTNKDPLTLVKAFLKFSETNTEAKLYVIFQQDDLLDEITNLTCNSDRIVLVGRINHEQLQPWFNSADFIISTSHYEGSGIAICEGMSCGCIPILTDIASFRMMTNRGECGLLFKPGDVQDLFRMLVKSAELNRIAYREKVLRQFKLKLSFSAIADKMLETIKAGDK